MLLLTSSNIKGHYKLINDYKTNILMNIILKNKNMAKLDINKLASLKTFEEHLQKRYGDTNSIERRKFEANAKKWYHAELLKH